MSEEKLDQIIESLDGMNGNLMDLGNRVHHIESTMATKEELNQVKKAMVTKEELNQMKKAMVTKEEFNQVKKVMVTKEEHYQMKKAMATKEDIQELPFIRQAVAEIHERTKAINVLTDKVMQHDTDIKIIKKMLAN